MQHFKVCCIRLQGSVPHSSTDMQLLRVQGSVPHSSTDMRLRAACRWGGYWDPWNGESQILLDLAKAICDAGERNVWRGGGNLKCG